jgi:hypothetical protein
MNSVALKERRERADYNKVCAVSLPRAARDSAVPADGMLSLRDRR